VSGSIRACRWFCCAFLACGIANLAGAAGAVRAPGQAASNSVLNLASIRGKSLTVTINADGSYSITKVGTPGPVLTTNVDATVDDEVLQSSAYPQHKTTQSEFQDEFGSGVKLTATHAGLPGKPDLVCTIRLYSGQLWGDITVDVHNTTHKPISVQSIHIIRSSVSPVVDLGASPSADRVLSDSFSEDRPQLAIHDLGDAPKGMLRAVGSQLIYNRESGQSLFLGALTTNRFLTIFHLKERGTGAGAMISSYEAESTGTTEIMNEGSLSNSPPEEQVRLSVPVEARGSLSSERVMFAVGHDYHEQLEQYGHVIKLLHKARVDAPTPIGWWSWTAYYFGLNEGLATTNANWLANNLKSSGYKYFQIDEGYQYARGEYITPDINLFPRGLAYTANKVTHDGLTFGVWTAPFEVSERASVYQDHKDWLLHNAAGQLIHIGYVTDHNDSLYVLDTTNPGAQEYLRKTYQSLRNWSVRFIKLDFMDDTAVEGAYFRPNTTALEAQRIGLEIIRRTMGDDTVLDKDGSDMLNPVGYVDAGRISQDTGHTFEASRDAASGIAARYYMNRKFFIADPDAFTVSTQTIDDQSWHGGQHPLTFEEAKVSIALAAVAGGMFELGDDLPTLGSAPERLALVKNIELLDMARLGRSSTPLDLLTYSTADAQPSIFLLKEDNRQSILTIFNWTEIDHKRSIQLSDLGMENREKQRITEIFDDKSCCSVGSNTINFDQPGHSVRMFKLVDETIPSAPPAFDIHAVTETKAGEGLDFTATGIPNAEPILLCRWDFGDGSTGDGFYVRHAYTQPGDYSVRATATGLEAMSTTKTITVKISGSIATRFVPSEKKRPEESPTKLAGPDTRP
jgi:alpha-galactosidase